MSRATDFARALEIGRPPNIQRLFPNSRALLVSGKVIDRAMLAKGKAMTMAANGRSHFVIRGALQAAQRADAALIIEIARSEGGAKAYCAINYWNMARQVDAVCNELGITVPVAIHADHYGIKKAEDLPFAKVEIPSLFDAGITSIAIDASHMPDDDNLLASIELARLLPDLGGLRDRGRRDQGQAGAVHRGRGPFSDAGPQCPRHISGLDRPEQRNHPRPGGQRPGHPGRTDRRDPRGTRPVRGVRRPARHFRQQLRAAAGHCRARPGPPRPMWPLPCR